MRQSYIKPDATYAKLSLDERLAKANLNFIPRLVNDTFSVDGLTWDTGEKVVVRPTQADENGQPINPRIATVGNDYCLTNYYDLFSKFDQPLLDSGFVPSGCHSFKNGGGARMFYTKADAEFGKRTGGHGVLKNAPRSTVFYIKTGINGLWSTGFGGYLYEQWCSNGASKQIWSALVSGIRHTKTHNDRLEDAIERFNWIATDMAGFSARMDALEKIKADEKLVEQFTLALIPNTDNAENKARGNKRTTLTNY